MWSTRGKWFCVTLILFFILFQSADAFIKLTNVVCKSFDKPFADFRSCRLTVVKRGVIALSLYVKLFQLPVNNVSINVSLFKKASGYRPFLNNVTADFCAFMANRRRFPFLKIFLDLLLTESNINHTCPYAHDIIVTNLVLHEEMFALLPVPAGEYMFKLMVGAYNQWKADIKAYFSIKLD